MIDLKGLVRKNVLNLAPYKCARDEYTPTDVIQLDANENPNGKLNRYPDPYQRILKGLLAIKQEVPEERIFIGNGSDEVLDLLFRVFCVPGKDSIIELSPTYGMYSVLAGINDIECISVPLNDNFQMDRQRIEAHLNFDNLKMIIVCSPNNPTGNCINLQDIDWLAGCFQGVLIVDEAYIDFCPQKSAKVLLERHENLVITQTFSKAYGLAAARVGVAYTSQQIVGWLNKVKPPYNVSQENQNAAIAVLQQEGFKDGILQIVSERERLMEILNAIPVIKKVYPSEANFLLVEVQGAAAVYKYLAERQIIVRNRHQLVPNTLRITIGNAEENNILINELKNYKV